MSNLQTFDAAPMRVLVIEDEALVSMFIEDTLTDIGCEVVGVASRFDEAMEKATTLCFDVAILDVNLNGKETFPIAKALQERGSAFVFATGYGASNLPSDFRSTSVLQKPFRQHDMERVLRAMSKQ